jgi:hypothetical protein
MILVAEYGSKITNVLDMTVFTMSTGPLAQDK